MNDQLTTLLNSGLADAPRPASETSGTAAAGGLLLHGVARGVAWDDQATTTHQESITKSQSRTEGESYSVSVEEGISKRGWFFSRITHSDGQSRTRGRSTSATVSDGRETGTSETAYVHALSFLLEVTAPDGRVYPWPVRVVERDANLATARLKKNSVRPGDKVLVEVFDYQDGVLEPSAIHNLTTGAVVFGEDGGGAFLPARQPGALPDIEALQRADLTGPAALPDGSPPIRLDAARLRLARVVGVRNFWEEADAGPVALRQAAVSAVAGLHTAGEPTLHALVGRPDGLTVYTGLGPLEPPPAPPPPVALLPPAIPPEPEPEPEPEPPPPPRARRRSSMLLLIPATTVGVLGLGLVGDPASYNAALAVLGFGGLTGLSLFALRRVLRPPAAPAVAEPVAALDTAENEPGLETMPAVAEPVATPDTAESEPLSPTAETALAAAAEPLTVDDPTLTTDPRETDAAREALLAATLRAVYPDIGLVEPGDGDAARLQETLAAMPFAGLIVGTPATHQTVNSQTVWPLEQLVRGLRKHGPWALVTIALPAAEAEAQSLRGAALRERQELADAAQASAAVSATARHYSELLEAYSRKLERGQQGLWHVGVAFLAADETTFRILATRLRAFGGPDALPDPLRVIPWDGGAPDIAELGLPAASGPVAGHVRYPYRWLSLLESGELATWLRLPAEEAPGYTVQEYAPFGQSAGRGDLGRDLEDSGSGLGRIVG